MREYFARMGLASEPQRLRTTGRALDRARLEAVVIRGDPRVLIARKITVRADLFLGLAIDCSRMTTSDARLPPRPSPRRSAICLRSV